MKHHRGRFYAPKRFPAPGGGVRGKEKPAQAIAALISTGRLHTHPNEPTAPTISGKKGKKTI